MCCVGSCQEKRLRIVPVTQGNRAAVEALRVATGQQGFIETVSQCMAEADQLALWQPVAIYDGQRLIGFAMYGLWEKEGENGRVWLDRFLIDRSRQGKGYAKPALRAIIELMVATYHCNEIYLSIYEDNVHALGIYQDLGFAFNGELDMNGEKVMVLRLPVLA